jgi:hypothetical protein
VIQSLFAAKFTVNAVAKSVFEMQNPYPELTLLTSVAPD